MRRTPTKRTAKTAPPPPLIDAADAEFGPGGQRGRGGAGTAGRRKRKDAKRFIEPFAYNDGQRAAIAEALEALGLGDEMTRDIFIGAIAYDLSVLDAALGQAADAASTAPTADSSHREDPPALDRAKTSASTQATPAQHDAPRQSSPSFRALAAKAAALEEALRDLPEPDRGRLLETLSAQDRFRRDHGLGYLKALQDELASLRAAASDPTASTGEEPVADPTSASMSAIGGDGPTPKAGASKPAEAPRSDAATAFIRHAASVYVQCFDTRPSPDAGGPFALALKAVADATDIPIPVDDASLNSMLTEP
jgi:hypothetical protein